MSFGPAATEVQINPIPSRYNPAEYRATGVVVCRLGSAASPENPRSRGREIARGAESDADQ